jgi:hypothetical protein
MISIQKNSMACCKIIFFSILVSFLCFPTIKAQDSTFLHSFCSHNGTTTNSTFQTNLMTLFSSLSSKAVGNTEFYNTTGTGINPSDSVYGLFMCRGDVYSQLCHECVVNATQKQMIQYKILDFHKIQFIFPIIAQKIPVQSLTKTSNYFSLICLPTPQMAKNFIV